MTSGDRPAILVVEDDAELRMAISEAIESEGYLVLTAENGCEALRRLHNGARRPCVILLDLMMPVMDGWQFREVQKAEAAIASIPVVAVSAHRDVHTFDADAALVKPVRLERLMETIERFCGLPS